METAGKSIATATLEPLSRIRTIVESFPTGYRPTTGCRRAKLREVLLCRRLKSEPSNRCGWLAEEILILSVHQIVEREMRKRAYYPRSIQFSLEDFRFERK